MNSQIIPIIVAGDAPTRCGSCECGVNEILRPDLTTSQKEWFSARMITQVTHEQYKIVWESCLDESARARLATSLFTLIVDSCQGEIPRIIESHDSKNISRGRVIYFQWNDPETGESRWGMGAPGVCRRRGPIDLISDILLKAHESGVIHLRDQRFTAPEEVY